MALFGIFAWVGVVYPGSAEPWNLALLAVFYSVVTWLGMLLFGKEVWLRHGEAFSLVFGLLARFSPTEVRVLSPQTCDDCSGDCRDLSGECVDCYECFRYADEGGRELNLRPFAVGLLAHTAVSPSRMVLVLLLLATVTFDGFTATSAWVSVADWAHSGFSFLGGEAITGVNTTGLILFPLLFMLVFAAFSAAMPLFARLSVPLGNVAGTFVYSLIPIALAYHLAHFFSFLLIQGQLMVPLASDPIGLGWDLLGTSDYRLDIGIVDARLAWIVAVIAIVVGHIVAVFVAHVLALRVFADRRPALRSRYPMLALMVGYTMLSLWIIAQPIVGTSS